MPGSWAMYIHMEAQNKMSTWMRASCEQLQVSEENMLQTLSVIWPFGSMAFFFLQFAITGRWCNPFLLTLFLSVFVHTKKHTHFITHAHTNPDCPPLSLLSLLSHIPVDVPDWRKSSVGLGQGHGSDNHILTVAPALSPGLQQHDTQPPSLHILTQACTNKRAQHTAQQKHTLLLRCCYDCHIVYGDGNS